MHRLQQLRDSISGHIKTAAEISTSIYGYTIQQQFTYCFVDTVCAEKTKIVVSGVEWGQAGQCVDDSIAAGVPGDPDPMLRLCISASKSSIRRFVITEKAPTSGYYRFHI